MKNLIAIFICLISVNVFAQNITNTLGVNGTFIIKDGTTTFMTLSQSTGYVDMLRSLNLTNTTDTNSGIIRKGGIRFLHNYGTNNTFLGFNTGNLTMTGTNNTVIGVGSLFSNTTGNSNTAVGYHSLFSNTTGNSNAAFGHLSSYLNTTGQFNTAVGTQSLYTNSLGGNNTAIGFQTLYNNTSSSNTAIGHGSLFTNTTGTSNTAAGYQSMYFNSTGQFNIATGTQSLYSNTGSNNSALGFQSLYSNTTGFNNTALGYGSGFAVTTGSNLTILGFNSSASSISATNEVTLGNNFITALRCNVTSITSLSDRRDKKNITDLTLGLDFISKLKPRQFNWDKREWYDDNVSDGSKMKEIPTAGFIAQELDETQVTENAEWLGLVYKDSPEKWEATYGNLLPVMVKAIQELKTENDSLKSEIETLKTNEARLANLEEMVSELIHPKIIEIGLAKK